MKVLKDIFKTVWAFMSKAFANTKWEEAVIASLNVIGPLIDSIVAILAGQEAAVLADKVIVEIKRDLGTLIVLVQMYDVGDHATINARVGTLSNEIKSNIGLLLTDGHIKNEATVSKVTGIVSMVVSLMDGILKNLPAAPQKVTA